MTNKEILEKSGELEFDSIANVLHVLDYLGVKQLADVQIIPGRSGMILEVRDSEGQLYFFGLSMFGYVETVRKDSLGGEIVYSPIE